MKSFLLGTILIATAAATAAADPILLPSVPIRIVGGSLVIEAGSSRVGPPESAPQAHASLIGSSGLTLSGAGTGFISCDEGCVPGQSVDLSSSVFLHTGTIMFGAETLEFDAFAASPGGVDLSFTGMESFTAPTRGTGAVIFSTPFTSSGSARAPGFLPPTVPNANPTSVVHSFDLGGAGVATGTFSFGELGGVDVLFFDNLRFDFTNQAPVPEPCSLLLLATGTALCARRRGRIGDQRR